MRLSLCLLIVLLGWVLCAFTQNVLAVKSGSDLAEAISENLRNAMENQPVDNDKTSEMIDSDNEDEKEDNDSEDDRIEDDDDDDEEDDIDNDAEEDTSGDDIMLSLKQSIQNELQTKWAIEEKDKAACCVAAFNLCEKPPGVSNAAFNKMKKSHLKVAKKACKAIRTQSLTNKNKICNFYSSKANCAYTPNTANDFDMYFEALTDCCAKANAYCSSSDDQSSLFQAKKACLGFASRTGPELCDFAQKHECQSALFP